MRRRDTEGYYYIDEINNKLPSVTTVEGVLAKPGLMIWAAREAAGYVRSEIIDKLLSGDMTLEQLAEVDINQLMKDAKNHHAEMRDKAANLGSRVHDLIHRYFSNLQIEPQPDEINAFNAFLDWANANKVSPILAEHTVWSKAAGGYAGTLDLICSMKPRRSRKHKLYVVDFKTGGAFYDEWIMQIAAYRYAPYPKGPAYAGSIQGAGIVRLDKVTGIPEWREYSRSECRLAYRRFLCLVEYWHKTKAGKNGDKK